MSTFDKDTDIDNVLEKIFNEIKSDIIQKLADEGENNDSNKLTTYKELKASKLYTNDTLFEKLKKSFAISSAFLNHSLPELFQIIDIISMSNIIYQDANSGLVEQLLDNILFSELKKLDSKVQTFYNSIDKKNESSKSYSQHAPDKATSYKLMKIQYNSNIKKYFVTYPDFLTDAFETIKNKLLNNTEYAEMINIELKEQEQEQATGPPPLELDPRRRRRQRMKLSVGQAPPGSLTIQTPQPHPVAGREAEAAGVVSLQHSGQGAIEQHDQTRENFDVAAIQEKPAPTRTNKVIRRARIADKPVEEVDIPRSKGQEWSKRTIERNQAEAEMKNAAISASETVQSVSIYAQTRHMLDERADHMFLPEREVAAANEAASRMTLLELETRKMVMASALVVHKMGNPVTSEANSVMTQATAALKAVVEARKKVYNEVKMANAVLTSNEPERGKNIKQWMHAKHEANDERKNAISKVNEVCSRVLKTI